MGLGPFKREGMNPSDVPPDPEGDLKRDLPASIGLGVVLPTDTHLFTLHLCNAYHLYRQRPSKRLRHEGYQCISDGVNLGCERKGERGGSHLPSIKPPLSTILCIKLVCDILIDSDHNVGFVRSEAENWE